MAFLLNKTAISVLRLRPQKADDSIALSRRGCHGDLGAREKAVDLLTPCKLYKPVALEWHECPAFSILPDVVMRCMLEDPGDEKDVERKAFDIVGPKMLFFKLDWS